LPTLLHPRRRGLTTAGLAAAFILVASATFAQQTKPQAKPDIGHFTLPNGLEVVVIPDRRAPVVTHMVWYKVGAADETPGKSGLAHFLEHLLFKGTAKNPAGRFSKEIAAVGGQENAFTSQDYTGYFQRVAREHLKAMMEFESDRMTNLVLTDEQVQPELKVVLEEHNQRVANNPRARLSEQIDAALYLNHPYGRPVIGWRQEIEKLNREEALAFYKRFYTPNNAVLVIAGDVSTEEVRVLAEETYGKVPKVAEIAPRLRPQEPLPAAARRLTLTDPRVAQPSMHRAYLVPSSSTAKPGESEALEVLAFILGHGNTSRLYRAVVEEQGLAVGAGGWYSGNALDATQFGVYGSPKPGVELPQLEAAIDAVIDNLVTNGVTAEEVERATSRLIAESVYAKDSQATMARWYGAALTSGGTVERVQSWPDRIRAVKPGTVHAAAKAYLDKRRSVTGYLIKETAPIGDKRS
jgi:zinc protease